MPRSDISFPLKDAELREDVHMLGALVGEVIREQGGDALFEAVEQDRQAAIARRDGSAEGARELATRTRDVPAAQARDLVRAFTLWFEMVNMAEKVHRIRRRRQYLNEGTTQPGGIVEAVTRLKAQGLGLEEIRRLMIEIWIEPVFTAHPTESTRRTILRKQQKIAQLLLGRLGLSRTAAETRQIWDRIRSEITGSWQTAENSRERLTVADEREHVLFFIGEILFQIVPIFYEEIEAALEQVYGADVRERELPEILRFGSWVGGDMDGNPDVHAKAIRETVARHQQIIINRYFIECQGLAETLSQSATRVGISPALQKRIEQYTTLLPGAATLSPARHDRMPYRFFLGQILERLRATYDSRANHYDSANEFLGDLNLIADSLRAHKGEHAGLFQVRRLIRRVRTFGFHLATLDIRQNAGAHRDVIAQGLADPQWSSRSSEQRTARLRAALEHDEAPTCVLDPSGKRSLWVFEALTHCRHRYGTDAIGPYVVSAARGVDDMLSVLLLSRWADTTDSRSGDVPTDVAPLFESAAALRACGEIMTQVFNEPAYRKHLIGRANHQYVMIGYSASNKESGIVMSRWLLRQAQEALFAAADAAGIDLTLFHGQGDGGFRGGGRTEVLVRSGPDSARRGRLRITEQGELINEKYGLRPIALRVFEQAFNALTLSRTGVIPPEHVDPQWPRRDGSAGRRSRARLSRDGVRGRGVRRLFSPGCADRRHRADADRLTSHLARRAQRHRGATLDPLGARVVAVSLHVARMVRRRQRAGARVEATRRLGAAPDVRRLVLLHEPDRRHRAGIGSRGPGHRCGVRRPGRREVPAVHRAAARRIRAHSSASAQSARRRASTGRRADSAALDYVA